MDGPGRGLSASGEEALGAYGLRLRGLGEAAADLLVPAPREWPEISISAQIGRASAPFDTIDNEQARLNLRNGGEIRIDRSAATAVIRTPAALRPHDLIHPYLAPVAAVMAWWLGRESFHAGAFVFDDGVWAILGEREAGKSTTLAWLAQQGRPIVCDDMLIIGDDGVFAGPRVLDLRREAAAHFDAGEALGVVGARERWRLRLEQAPEGLPLCGWVFLAWGDDVDVARVPAPERVGRLAAQRGLRVPPEHPERMLDLISLPAWQLRRPRGWESLGHAADRLLAALGGRTPAV